jgi:hypothetical protein
VLLDRELVRVLMDLAPDLIDDWLRRLGVQADTLGGFDLLSAEQSWLALLLALKLLFTLKVVKVLHK